MCATGAPEGGKAPGAVLRGGGLEAPRPDGFAPMGFDNAFVFADKVVSVGRQVEPDWVAVYALGGLSKDAGYTSLEQAAESVLTCMTDSAAFYDAFSGRTDQGSSALTVDGHDAWRITAEVRVDDPEVSVKGDVATVIVVDTGAPGTLRTLRQRRAHRRTHADRPAGAGGRVDPSALNGVRREP